MPSVFTMIMSGDLPGRFVWQDEQCAAFLTIAPITVGHTLVVPRAEIDHWLDLDESLAAHLMTVARHVGKAQMAAFQPSRVGLIIAGLEVPHAHVHVIPMETEADLDFRRADAATSAEVLDDAAARLGAALRHAGHAEAGVS